MKLWYEVLIICNILAAYQHNFLAISGFAFGAFAYLQLREGL